VNTQDLADKLATANGMSKADARKTVDAVFDAIAETIKGGEEVSLNGFGKFSAKDTPERQGRNPSTGAAITIAAGKKVSFQPAKGLKDRVAA
jgi:DNA-binding protein HU-beta